MVRRRPLTALALSIGLVALASSAQSAEPGDVPWGWRLFAFRSYLALQRVDVALLEPRLPPQLFYNLVLSAWKP